MSPSASDVIHSGAFYIAFQPIVCCVRQQVLGYEALLRPVDTQLWPSALALFMQAEKDHQGALLRKLAALTAITCFANAQLDGSLYLNVNPNDFIENPYLFVELTTQLNQHGMHASQVVLEMTEQVACTGINIFHSKAIALGFAVAIDDLGAAHSGLNRWASLRPALVKLDRQMICDIDQDQGKQAIVTSMVTLAKTLQCELIAEGVETSAELHTLLRLGVERFQGYLFAKPKAAAALAPVNWSVQLLEAS